jgi:hypothetical protein
VALPTGAAGTTATTVLSATGSSTLTVKVLPWPGWLLTLICLHHADQAVADAQAEAGAAETAGGRNVGLGESLEDQLELSCGMPMPVSVTASSRRQRSAGWPAGNGR